MRMNERRTKMSSVKRKLTNKTLVQKCEIIRHIEKGMTNKEAFELVYKGTHKFIEAKRHYRESTSSLYLLLCNAFNSYKKLIVHHITTYLFFSFSFPEIYELLSISNSRTNPLVPYEFKIERVHCRSNVEIIF